MILREYQEKRGVAKCRTCNCILPLTRFKQWESGGQKRISVTCEACCPARVIGNRVRRPGSALRSPAYLANCETITKAKSVPCMDCGIKFPIACMDIDHRDATQKTHIIARLKSRRPEILAAEIAKCDVVCACCHRIRSANRGWSKGRPRATP